MKTIYKYKINNPALNKIKIKLPRGASIVESGNDCYEVPCFWAFVDTDQPLVEHTFFLVGTGWDVDDFLEQYSETKDVEYIGIIKDEPYIWHLMKEV